MNPWSEKLLFLRSNGIEMQVSKTLTSPVMRLVFAGASGLICWDRSRSRAWYLRCPIWRIASP